MYLFKKYTFNIHLLQNRNLILCIMSITVQKVSKIIIKFLERILCIEIRGKIPYVNFGVEKCFISAFRKTYSFLIGTLKFHTVFFCNLHGQQEILNKI